MGIIRKVISGSAAVATGGASLAVIQYRSDTERNTRQLVKLRQEVAHSNSTGGGDAYVVDAVGGGAVHDPSIGQVAGVAGTDALALVQSSRSSQPQDTRAGWKPDPDAIGQERFWNGKGWTSKTRK